MPARGLSEGTGEEGLPSSGGACDENDLMMADPVGAGQAKDVGAVEAAGGAKIEIFDAGRQAELCLAQKPREASILADGDLALGEKAKAVVEGEPLDVRYPLLLLESGSHPVEAEFAQSEQGLFKKHGPVPPLDVEY